MYITEGNIINTLKSNDIELNLFVPEIRSIRSIKPKCPKRNIPKEKNIAAIFFEYLKTPLFIKDFSLIFFNYE